MIGLSVGDTTVGTLVANLGYDELTMPKPVFIGDTLRAVTMIAEPREPKDELQQRAKRRPAQCGRPRRNPGADADRAVAGATPVASGIYRRVRS